MISDGFLNDVQLQEKIVQHIKSGKYRLSKHAYIEQAHDELDVQDTLHVLKTGVHKKTKTTFSNKYQVWHYAIEGKTEERKNVRVIIAFSTEMMIITVMEL